MNRYARMGCLALAVFAAACGKKKDASDAGADGGDEAATATADAGSEVVPSNATGVARFGDESKLDGSSVALSFATPVHAEPGTGAVVATLAKGTQVTLVAEHGTATPATLVTFPDPKNASSTLIGWVPSTAVGKNVAVAPAHTINCPAGKVAVFGNLCAQPCKTNADCPGVGRTCTETPKANGGGKVVVCLPP
jgi:hypothetical protein